jgi:hypothetical protein
MKIKKVKIQGDLIVKKATHSGNVPVRRWRRRRRSHW